MIQKVEKQNKINIESATRGRIVRPYSGQRGMVYSPAKMVWGLRFTDVVQGRNELITTGTQHLSQKMLGLRFTKLTLFAN